MGKTSKVLNNSIWSFLVDQNGNILNEFYKKPNIVYSLFKYFTELEQTAILKTMSGAMDQLYSASQTKIVEKKLAFLKIMKVDSERIRLNSEFREKMDMILSVGLPSLFRVDAVQSASERESLESSIGKWVGVYQFMLKNIGCPQSSALSKSVQEVLAHEKLVIDQPSWAGESFEAPRAQDQSWGFEFLIESKNFQMNKLVNLYVRHFLKKQKKRIVDQNLSRNLLFEIKIYLVDLICFLSNTSPSNVFDFCGANVCSRVSGEDVRLMFRDLESLGFLRVYPPSAEPSSLFRFSTTELMRDLLSNQKDLEKELGTNLIVENDFKIYAYSKFLHTNYLLSLFSDLKVFFPGLTIAKFNEHKISLACQRGINSKQILNFLMKNLHPAVEERKQRQLVQDFKGKTSAKKAKKLTRKMIPENVYQQIILWGSEDFQYLSQQKTKEPSNAYSSSRGYQWKEKKRKKKSKREIEARLEKERKISQMKLMEEEQKMKENEKGLFVGEDSD